MLRRIWLGVTISNHFNEWGWLYYLSMALLVSALAFGK